MLFDSHAHINAEDNTPEMVEELALLIENSKLDYCVDIGTNLETSKLAARHAERFSWCYAAVGIHPQYAESMNSKVLDEIRKLALAEKVMAIGEIGLDYHYEKPDRGIQREAFRRQIRLANELHLPICVHSREADRECMDMLKEEGAFSSERKGWFHQERAAQDARVLLHCFSGSAELAEEYVKMGAVISIAGPVTFKNNRKTVRVVESIPLDFLMVETDSPYLSPEPVRGRRNVPTNVEYTARKIAEIKGISFEAAADIMCGNALKFYGISFTE